MQTYRWQVTALWQVAKNKGVNSYRNTLAKSFLRFKFVGKYLYFINSVQTKFSSRSEKEKSMKNEK